MAVTRQPGPAPRPWAVRCRTTLPRISRLRCARPATTRSRGSTASLITAPRAGRSPERAPDGTGRRRHHHRLHAVPCEQQLFADRGEHRLLRLPRGRLEQHADLGRLGAEPHCGRLSNDLRYLPHDDELAGSDLQSHVLPDSAPRVGLQRLPPGFHELHELYLH